MVAGSALVTLLLKSYDTEVCRPLRRRFFKNIGQLNSLNQILLVVSEENAHKRVFGKFDIAVKVVLSCAS